VRRGSCASPGAAARHSTCGVDNNLTATHTNGGYSWQGTELGLTIIGVLLLAAGLILMLAIVPGMKKMPDDTDTTRDYEGTMVALLNPSDFTYQKMLPITLQRHFAVAETTATPLWSRKRRR